MPFNLHFSPGLDVFLPYRKHTVVAYYNASHDGEPLFESSVSGTAAVSCILQDEKHYA